jgi:hypothetical protein
VAACEVAETTNPWTVDFNAKVRKTWTADGGGLINLPAPAQEKSRMLQILAKRRRRPWIQKQATLERRLIVAGEKTEKAPNGKIFVVRSEALIYPHGFWVLAANPLILSLRLGTRAARAQVKTSVIEINLPILHDMVHRLRPRLCATVGKDWQASIFLACRELSVTYDDGRDVLTPTASGATIS